MTLTQGHSGEVMGRKSAKFVSGLHVYFFLWINIGSYFTKRLHMTWVYHAIDRRIFGQGLGHWREKCKIRVRFLFFLWIIIGCSYFTQWLPMGWGCVMTLTQCYLGKINVSGRKSAKIVSNPYHSYGYTFEVCSHKDRLWPVGVSWLWLKVIWTRARTLTGKVKNLYLVYMLKHYKFLFRTKIAHILNVCHDLDQGNLGKFNA